MTADTPHDAQPGVHPTAGPRMRFVDLSHPIKSGMPVYPGDPEVTVEPALTIARDGGAVSRLTLSSHTGTHMDAPRHTVEGGAAIDEIPLDWLVGEALILRAAPPSSADSASPGTATRISTATFPGISATAAATASGSSRITETTGAATTAATSATAATVAASAVVLAQPVPKSVPRIVVIDTGWASRLETPSGLDHPWIAEALADRLWAAGARVLGIDTPSPDAPASRNLPVHDLWLGRGGVIVENLTNLSQIPDRCELILAPLRLEGLDGSPIRALAHVVDNVNDNRTDTGTTTGTASHADTSPAS